MASRKEDKEYLEKALNHHRGKWLNAEIIAEYQKKAAKLPDNNRQLTGERRTLCYQLMDECGVTELEAVNNSSKIL